MTILLPLMIAIAIESSPTTVVSASNAQVSVQARVEPEIAAPNTDLTLTFTVTPARGIHVYAPGSEYRVVAVRLDPHPGLKAHKTTYPPSELFHFEPLNELVPVYQKPFTLKQVITVAPAALKGRKTLALSGALEYQACDDRVCYKPNAIPFRLEVEIKR